jgi:hypothetical protein
MFYLEAYILLLALPRSILVAARSKAWVYGRSFVGILGSNPAGVMAVFYECRVLSGRGFCDGPISRPEESYRMCV